ncbi:MAG: helix-turn-helix domain-containing protein [Pleurocapsa sp. SU_196_0]|nr:helix-turn-helix domain-containing protein [Pleurocapsa sp. SU_196_0]
MNWGDLHALIARAAATGAREGVRVELAAFLERFAPAFIATQDDTVLTLEETATYLRLDTKTVTVLIHAGEIAGRKCGAQWRIPKWALRRYLDSR